MGVNKNRLRKILSIIVMVAIVITTVPNTVYGQKKDYSTYVMKDGDTIKEIAKTYHTGVGKIMQLNKFKKFDAFYAGKVIKVPGKVIDNSVNVNETVVKTQKELEKALMNNKAGIIRISTAEKVKFEIPSKDYSSKDLIIDAKNADVVNKGSFHQIIILTSDKSTFYEYGSKNIIIVKSPLAHLVIDHSAKLGKVILEDTNKEIKVDNYTNKQIKLRSTKNTLKLNVGKGAIVKNGVKEEEYTLQPVTTTPTLTPTLTPTKNPEPEITPTTAPMPTVVPTATPTLVPTATPAPEPTGTPTPVPEVPSDVVDFSTWKLQLPIAADNGLSVKEVYPAELNAGYTHDEYFYVDTDGGIVFYCPVDGFKTANTNYARTELREIIDGKNAAVNWGWNGTHILRTSETVEEVSSNGRTVVSQIHGIYPNGDNGPVLVKVQYEHDIKAVVVMLKTGTAANAAEQRGYFYGVELGQRFDTEIKCVEGVLYVTISSEGREETYTLNFMEMDPTWGGQRGYFKVGNYIQDSDKNYENEGARVKVYSVETFHDDNYVEQVELKGLSMKQSEITLGIGETVALELNYAPVDATNKAVTYSVISGQDKAAVNKQGVVTAISEGKAVVRAVSVENESIYADSILTITLDSQQEVMALYEQDFGTDVPFDIATANEWLIDTAGSGNVQVVNEDGNYILKFTDTDTNGTAKSLVYFPEQTDTTTISYMIRVDEVLVKDPDGAKAQASYLYLPVGGADGFMKPADEMFRIRNGATYQGGILINHRWQLSHTYSDAVSNYSASEFVIGQWKEITVVTTPNNGTASANITDIYMDGYKVGSQIKNNNESSFINQAEFYTGTKDQVSFSIDDIRIYSGINVTESEDAKAPENIAIGTVPSIIAAGDSFRITTVITPADAKEAVTYVVTDGVGNVSVSKDGLVTAIKSGSATIRVYSTGHEEVYTEFTITILNADEIVRVESIDLTEKSINLTEGETKQLIPIISPINATEQTVRYEVLRGFDVVTISSLGELKGEKTGSAAVRITSMDNKSLYVDCEISVTKKVEEGSIIFKDSFDGPLDLDKWTLATANINNTVTEVIDGALHLKDDNVSGQPRAYLTFEPQASTFTIEFKIKIESDKLTNANKVSAICAAFGTGAITATANETFRFKSAGDVKNDSIENRRFVYSKGVDANGFNDINQAYELDEWYTVKFVTTPNDGSERANTTDIYINDILLVEGAENKTKEMIIDKLIFQTGSADLTEFWIDDVVITSGGNSEQTPEGESKPLLVYEENFENGTLPEASSTTNPSIRPSWKLTKGTDYTVEIAEDMVGSNALKLYDFSAGNHPKAQLIFNPITKDATIEFQLKIESDEVYTINSTEKASSFCFVFGSTADGTITTKSNEMFRFKTTATVVNTASGSAIMDRKFQYEKEDANSFVTLEEPNYELDTYYTIKFLITAGEGGKTEMYVNGVKIGEGFNKKSTDNIDTILFQSGSNDLTKYWIDNVKVYQGHKVE